MPNQAAAQNSNSVQPAQRAVLVTGASSGIGRNIAETLAAKGYFVYAGARKDKDLKALSAIDNIQGIRLDVTIQAEIDAAVDHIKQQGRGLYGLVNNAGVAVMAPMIEVSEESMQFQMDVNLFGPYRVTKAFAPLIMASKGRISTVGSIAGVQTGLLTGPYSISKHAVEAFTDALAKEMAKFDVQVSVIEPGNYNSNVIKSMRKRMAKQDSGQTMYQAEYEALSAYFPADRSQFKAPDEVSAAVMHALFSDSPKRRYMVVPAQREAEFTINNVLRRLVELNADHPYSYDRDELVAMLDAALK